MLRVWRDKCIPSAWQIGRIKLLDKGKGTGKPGEMRPISILNSEGRLFWTVYQERLATYMTGNGYIDRSVQKAFLPGMAGCIEHGTMAAEMFKDAKQRQRQICAIWLDLANAYGSVRHSMVYFALQWYHVPEDMIDLIFNYYEGICLQVQTEDWNSDWFGLEIGVPQGCTASTIVFDVAFQLVLDIHASMVAGKKGIGYAIDGMRKAVSAPAYADDVELVTSSPKDCQISINAFEKALGWTKTMKLKPPKCKSLAFRKFKKGQVTKYTAYQDRVYSSYDPLLLVYGKPSSFIGHDKDSMFKYLGMWIQANLKSDLIRQKVKDMLTGLLERLDKLLLTGAMKAWIANHYICAKISWALLIQDFPISLATEWDGLMKRFYRKWFNLARSAEPGVLYRATNDFGLNLKSLRGMLEQLQVVKWHILKTSQDEEARLLYNRRVERDKKGHVGTGRRDSPCLLIERTQRRVELDEFAFSGQTGKSGLGFHSSKTKQLSEREKILSVLKEETEERRLRDAYTYEMQANWVDYGLSFDVRERKDLTWRKLLRYQPKLLSFTLNAQSNTLPSPDNLRRWGRAKDVACGLCGRLNVTLGHILCGCIWVNKTEMNLPRESRFKWRHDCVLAVVVKAVRGLVGVINSRKPRVVKGVSTGITFVRAGQQPTEKPKEKTVVRESILDLARDWEVMCDLPFGRAPGSVFVFPADVALSSAKPDLIIMSRSLKICIVWELTSPLEENIQSWHSKKLLKYEEDLGDNVQPGWTLHILAGEVGAKGWIPPTYIKDLRRVFGFSKRECATVADNCAYVARQCSYVIWLNRRNRDFRPMQISPPEE
jgi:hypothetical protein